MHARMHTVACAHTIVLLFCSDQGESLLKALEEVLIFKAVQAYTIDLNPNCTLNPNRERAC